MSSSPGSAARSARRVAAVSATIRTCWPNAAPPRLIRGAPVCSASRARATSPIGTRYASSRIPPYVATRSRSDSLPRASATRGEVRIGLGGDRRAHRRPGLDRALDDRRVLRLELREPLGVDADEQAPPVGRVRLAAHEAGPLEPIEDAGHRAAREVAQLGQARRGHLRLAGRELEAAQVGRVDAEAGCHDLVRPDRLGDQPAQGVRGGSRG